MMKVEAGQRFVVVKYPETMHLDPGKMVLMDGAKAKLRAYPDETNLSVLILSEGTVEFKPAGLVKARLSLTQEGAMFEELNIYNDFGKRDRRNRYVELTRFKPDTTFRTVSTIAWMALFQGELAESALEKFVNMYSFTYHSAYKELGVHLK